MKKWLIMTGSLIAVLALLATALVITYHRLLSKNFLVAKIEEAIDSRVQLGDFRVSLFSVPAKVVIEDVIITRRDDLAREGVAHDERPKMDGGEIQLDEIRFDVSLRELLAREIKVAQLVVRGAHFDLKMNPAGELNIEPLFAAPPETEKKRSKEKLNAGDGSGFVTELDRLLIEDSSFDLLIEKTGLEIVGRELTFDLFDIRVDPNALEKINEAHLDFAAELETFSATKGRQKYGQLGLKGPARVRLFDPASGTLAPDAEIKFDISRDSYVSAKAPYIVKLWTVTDTLHKIGLKKQPLPERLTFGGDRVIDGSYRRNRIDLRQPVSLMVEDWELALDGGSWVETGTEQHRSSVQLIASAKLSGWVDEHLGKLVEVVPEELRDQLHQKFRAQLFVEDRLALKAGTRGPLSNPKVELETGPPDVKEVIRDYAKTRLMDLLIDKLGE